MADFNELLKVLRHEKPSRSVLFEFFLNDRLYEQGCGSKYVTNDNSYGRMCNMVNAFYAFGYDYATVLGSDFSFPTLNKEFHNNSKTVSLNEISTIFDRESFNKYEWMDASKCDYSNLKRIENELYPNQKVIVMGPGGVLENVIALMGYDNLCLMIYDDEQLVYDVFEKVGSCFVDYYNKCAPYNSVGALISNDDWGFNTQTMLSVKDMQRFVFPWHKKIVETIHKYEKPAILHSCGNYNMILNDLLNLKYDARHSYEDNIMPVEKAYELFKGKMAVLGGIDLNFLITSDVKDIEKRCKNMLKLAENYGGYALGSGNSIPDYVPDENYFAMINSIK